MNPNDQINSSDQGFVYVLTNEAMPGLVKIGITRANDPNSRIGDLYTTGVPLPFELEYAALTDNPKKVERALHNAFRKTRVNPNREFFELDPDQAIGILKLLDNTDYTETARTEADNTVPKADKKALERAKKRRPPLNFDDLDISMGTLLTFVDEQTTVEVTRPRKVKLVQFPEGHYQGIGADGTDVSLWPLTHELRECLWGVKNTGGLTEYWRLPDGQLLSEIYDEAHGPRA